MLGLDAPAAPLAITLPRGTGFDRRAAPAGASVGFGSFVMDVQGFLAPGGDTQLVWSLAVALGRRAGGLTITARLLGADSAAALLQPRLGVPIPAAATTAARFVRTAGRLVFRLDRLPVAFSPAPPATATAQRLELSVGAGRRVVRTFYHRLRVPTASGGSRVERVRDHRLVAYELLRTPSRCAGSWSYSMLAGGRTTAGRIACQSAL